MDSCQPLAGPFWSRITRKQTRNNKDKKRAAGSEITKKPDNHQRAGVVMISEYFGNTSNKRYCLDHGLDSVLSKMTALRSALALSGSRGIPEECVLDFVDAMIAHFTWEEICIERMAGRVPEKSSLREHKNDHAKAIDELAHIIAAFERRETGRLAELLGRLNVWTVSHIRRYDAPFEAILGLQTANLIKPAA